MYCEPANCYCAEILGDMNKLFHKNDTYYVRPEKVKILCKIKNTYSGRKMFFPRKEYKIKGKKDNEIWYFFQKPIDIK